MFFALMIIDGQSMLAEKQQLVDNEEVSFLSGIFKNNQAQVDEYMSVLNPLLRRTTEGNSAVCTASEQSAKDSSCVATGRTSSLVTNSECPSPKSRSSLKGQEDLSSSQPNCMKQCSSSRLSTRVLTKGSRNRPIPSICIHR
jgi:hypothetical protein